MYEFHGYTVVKTSAEVILEIRKTHKDELVVFSSYSAPESGCMETTYGFTDADYPLIGIRRTWDQDEECDYKRVNEVHEYWLILPEKDDMYTFY